MSSMLPQPFAAALLGILLFLPGPGMAQDNPSKRVAGLPSEKALALGERMYRQGLLPSGEPMQSVVSGDIPVDGTTITCVSCHVRSGVGSLEGGIVTLPTNGAKLAQTRYWKFPNLSPAERRDLKLQYPKARDPYTDETLAHVLQTGIDPSGRELNHVMPRFVLEERDMAILIHYLRSLSVKPSPGVDAETIRFATIITEEVSAEDQEAMLVPMNNFVARHNTHASGFGNRMYMSIGGREMSGAYRKIALSTWRLKGEPETWGKQLEEYLAKDAVFGLLGGISYREWKPIHAFCETHKLPCLFPLTDLPVISDTDWYTQYFSKGYFQEGQAAARYLKNLEDPAAARRVLQIIQEGPEGRELATGFRETWQELGQAPAKELRLGKGEALTFAYLSAMIQQERPSAILLWAGAECFQALEGLSGSSDRPGFLFLSGRLLGFKTNALPESARSFTWLTYPYREPQEESRVSRYANSLLAGLSQHRPETRISTRTYSLLQIFQTGLMDMDRNFYRDNLLDQIGMQRDSVLPDYLRLSFGPGQRYASKGCYIMQIGPGAEPKLVRKSDWVTH